jgi:4-carboxymuconolactone decarboxylase
MADDDTRYEAGMAIRRKVLGDAHVDRAGAQAGDLDRDFQTFIAEGVWGSVWTRPHFSLRERSIVTIALLAALGQDDELALHIRAARNTGATMEDVRETLLHVAAYAGVPAANHAFKIARTIYAELGTGAER